MSWSAERIEQLKTLWAEGYSASKIAGKLRYVSRSAVLCKVHRLKLPSRETLVTERGIRCTKRKSKSPKRHRRARPAWFGRPRRNWQPSDELAVPANPASAEIWQATPGQTTVSLIDLEDGMCRWPFGDLKAGDLGFCGAPQAEGVSFCAHHAQLAFKSRGYRT